MGSVRKESGNGTRNGHGTESRNGHGTESRGKSDPRPSVSRSRLVSLKRPWNEYLEKKGLNTTSARDLVVETFLCTVGHVELGDLHARVREVDPGIGLATVYRTVKLMQEAGVADARHFSARGTVYEVAVGRDHHDHLICEECGKIVEFSDPEIERLQEEIAAALGFQLAHHRHELFGRCAACRSSAAR